MATPVSKEDTETGGGEQQETPARRASARNSELRRASEQRKTEASGSVSPDSRNLNESEPVFPKGRRPSTGTDIGFEESTSGSELEQAPPVVDTTNASDKLRGSMAKRGSSQADIGAGSGDKRKPSNSGSLLKSLEPASKRGSKAGDEKAPRKQWGSARSSKGTDGFDLENPEVKELLRRLSKTEESSSSSSSGHARIASPKPGEFHRGIKALHRAVQENELPMRLAYEQLDELAANAERVKFAIERNRSLLTLQVKKANERIMRVAFMAWRMATQWRQQKRLHLKQARSWRKGILLSRAFKTWHRLQILGLKAKRMHNSAVKILQRHKLQQVWKAWAAMAKESANKNENFKKEKRLQKDFDKKHRHFLGKRVGKFLHRSRLRRCFHAFQPYLTGKMDQKPGVQSQYGEGVEMIKLAREYLRQILIYLLKKLATRVFHAWRGVAQSKANQRAFLKARLQTRTRRKCVQAWRKLLDKDIKEEHFLNTPFDAWRKLAKSRRDSKKQLRNRVSKLDRSSLARSFHAFEELIQDRRRLQSVVARRLQKKDRQLMSRCFQAWISFMQMGTQKKMTNVQKIADAAERENERLRTENERLTTIIDSGDWNKDRVAELVEAQKVLSGERLALTKLIGRLQRQHTQALQQQEEQEQEIRKLKEQLLSENNYFQRNKLLVKGASSFNTLMRVMKDDMLKRGTTPEVVYAVDNLAMDQVSVFPDGELHVKAVKQRNKGKWSSRLSTTGTTRTPSVMSYKPRGSPHQHTTHPHTPRTPLKPRPQETTELEPTTPYRYLYADKV